MYFAPQTLKPGYGPGPNWRTAPAAPLSRGAWLRHKWSLCLEQSAPASSLNHD